MSWLITLITKITRPRDIDRRTVLQYFLGYRLLLASLLSLAFLLDQGPDLLGRHDPGLYGYTLFAYTVLTALSLAISRTWRRWPDIEYLSIILIDSAAITLLMHASGGVTSGLGMLLALSIAFGSMAMSGKFSLLFAAVASLAVLTEVSIAWIYGLFETTGFTQAGLLGTSFFALAVLAHYLALQTEFQASLAQQRGKDLANLATLNEHVIQQMRSGILVADELGTVHQMNSAARDMLGIQAASETPALQTLSDQLYFQMQAWLHAPWANHLRFRPENNPLELDASFIALGSDARNQRQSLIFLEDTRRITEQAQQMKLASLGQLSASIAHEIRNPLGAISHAAQLLQESPELTGTDRRMTEIITTNSRRINDVVENVLALSRRQPLAPEHFWLADRLPRILANVGRDCALAPEQMEYRVDPADLSIHADPSQLEQVIGILLSNAVKHFDRDAGALRLHVSAAAAGENAFLQVCDNGSGIPDEIVDKIFDPFFTTRNDGSGLGLYIARALCEANHIRLEYRPAEGGGSCFHLSFRQNDSHKTDV